MLENRVAFDRFDLDPPRLLTLAVHGNAITSKCPPLKKEGIPSNPFKLKAQDKLKATQDTFNFAQPPSFKCRRLFQKYRNYGLYPGKNVFARSSAKAPIAIMALSPQNARRAT